MYDFSEEHRIDFIRIGENKNLVRLSTAYNNNCSEQEYVEVNDETLEYMLLNEKEISSKNRNFRRKTIPVPEEDNKAAKVGLINSSAEDCYFCKYDKEEISKILDILSLLTKCERRRIYLHYKLGLTYKEIGKLDKVGCTAIHHCCNKGIKKLRPYYHFLQKTHVVDWMDLLI